MHTRAPRRLLVLALLAAAGGAAACGDSTGTEEPSIEGSYRLVEINGQLLPFTYGTCGLGVICQVPGGHITVRAHGKLLDIKERQQVSGGQVIPQEPDTQTVSFIASGKRVLLKRVQAVASDNYIDTVRVQADGQVLVLHARRLFQFNTGGPYTLSYVKE